jgi:selenide,water dikinase
MASTQVPGEIRLTSFSSCAGCAAKIGQKALAEMLDGLPVSEDPNLMVGSGTGDDAGIYRIDAQRALVQTLDFFTPIVDEPYDFGRIAATNALSDVYAMGGRPLTAMNIVGMPATKLPATVIREILRGGAEVVRPAGCSLVGGHSIRSPEPIYGLSVTGMVHPDRVIANTGARPGDVLILTKPLGTGIITTAIKRGLASPSLAGRAIESMCSLNAVGAELGERGLVRAGTDVTGFGLLGHLANICRGSGVSAVIEGSAVPVLGGEVLQLIDQDCVPGGTVTNLSTADELTDWGATPDRIRVLLADAQTSGPLLLCVSAAATAEVDTILGRYGTLCRAVVGRVVERQASLISVR